MSLPEQTPLIDEKEKRASEPPVPRHKSRKSRLTVREMTVFAMLGALMFCSKLLMEWAPNIHFLALFLIVFTLVYRAKALIPLYVFVLLTGVYMGFHVWWLAYLYAWLPLWGAVMLLPRRMPRWLALPLYMLLGGLHGLLFGALCAPVQAFFFGLDFRGTLLWIANGALFDVAHAIGNLAACALVPPLTQILHRLERR